MEDVPASQPPAEIKAKAVDYITSGAKAILGAAPFVGPLLAELAGTIIPNQRLERITHFAALLEARIADIEENLIREAFQDEEFTDLLEGALHQAARATTEDRREYLASLIASSLTSEAIEHIESKHLLRLLGELNDIEIIWLRAYLRPTIGGDEEFRSKHASVLERRIAYIGCSIEELDKHALQESYRDHLFDLGLLSRSISRDSRTRMPEFDTFSGEFKVSYYRASPLGRLLLRTIGIQDAEFEERRIAEQVGTGQPATRLQSKSEGGDNPNPEPEGRSR